MNALISQILDKPAQPLGQYEVRQTSTFTVALSEDITQVGFMLSCPVLGTDWEVQIGNDEQRLSHEVCADTSSTFDEIYPVKESDQGSVDVQVMVSDGQTIYLVIYGVS